MSSSRSIKLPSAVELAKLPRWARIALAVRCADRLSELVRVDSPRSLLARRAAAVVDLCIVSALEAARLGSDKSPEITYAAALVEGEEESLGVMMWMPKGKGRSAAQREVANRIKAVAERARQYLPAVVAARATIRAVMDSTASVREAVEQMKSTPYSDIDCIAVVRSDYQALRIRAKGYSEWTDASPVDAELLGELWPFGLPERWPTRRAPAPTSRTKRADLGDIAERLSLGIVQGAARALRGH